MASSSTSILCASFLVVLWSSSCRVYANKNGCFSSLINFGDSISDTGNTKQLSYIYPGAEIDQCGPPYGQDYFGEATGRCSNGRLIVDFLAESLGLPFPPPYVHYNESQGLEGGVNFATAGATAMDSSSLKAVSNGSVAIHDKVSLRVQMGWLKKSVSTFLCANKTTSECRDFIGRSLIILGELGCNDYMHVMKTGDVMEETKPFVPLIIDTLISTVNELIEMGARTIVVPGIFPMGCLPWVLVTFVLDGDEYDPVTGCLVRFNDFSIYHNKVLQLKLNQARELNPNINIIYADYYNAAMQMFLFPDEYGFKNGVINTCCGGGGPYNFNARVRCGDPFSTVCDEPDTYGSWDGLHFTEAAYRAITKNMFQGPYTTPKFNSLCPMIEIKNTNRKSSVI